MTNIVSKNRKFPRNLENPIDNLIIDYGQKLYPLYRYLKLVPNDLTSISLILGVISSYLFYRGYFICSAICYFISYCYDVMDGNYAREYKLVSNFGDYYDHIKDIFVNILMFFVFIKFNKLKNHKLLISLVSIFLFITFNLHLGCQELYVSHNNPEQQSFFLKFLTILCSKKTMKHINILKYFGCGTFALWISFIIFLNN